MLVIRCFQDFPVQNNFQNRIRAQNNFGINPKMVFKSRLSLFYPLQWLKLLVIFFLFLRLNTSFVLFFSLAYPIKYTFWGQNRDVRKYLSVFFKRRRSDSVDLRTWRQLLWHLCSMRTSGFTIIDESSMPCMWTRIHLIQLNRMNESSNKTPWKFLLSLF